MDFFNLLMFICAVQIKCILIKAESKIIFAALNSMIEAVHVEHQLLEAIETYNIQRKSKLGAVKRVYEKWSQLHQETECRLRENSSDIPARIKLIQRITSYWQRFKTDFLDKSDEREQLEDTYSGFEPFIPDEKDLRGFSRLLIVNSETYETPYSELLAPRSNYVTVDEMMELSYRVIHHRLGYSPHDSLLKASTLALYGLTDVVDNHNSEVALTSERFEYLSNITEGLYQTGYWKVGFNLCKAVNKLFPDIKEFHFKEKLFQSRWKEDKFLGGMEIARDLRKRVFRPDSDNYSRLCRQRDLVLPTGPELKCYYFHKNPHLRHFAAYKLEEISHSPLVRMYHDVLLDGEIHLSQKIAVPLLHAAKVYNRKTGGDDISDHRVSNNGWLYDPDKNPHLDQPPELEALYRTLTQRLEDCTTLNKEGAESIQMNNYGIGGHYLWHYDALYDLSDLDYYPNDRIATWMFYLNDVKKGGNTVYPRLNISIPPKKGSAVFWYNLHPSGNADYRTLHGGCPILQGTKWVANIWVTEHEQILVHPCPLVPEPETSER